MPRDATWFNEALNLDPALTEQPLLVAMTTAASSSILPREQTGPGETSCTGNSSIESKTVIYSRGRDVLVNYLAAMED
ncbi:hypothetical protein scyTo_0015204 [Scyliorhinus torazame]|uniref:Uncharacterized protein n=1 Tax=Scyliorhinus torazame TaxID=75743 RepID=A0A401P534_SCYTO|nr:hypothetical protein [Scyliorhinus torazame]